MSATTLPTLLREGSYRLGWLRPDLIAGVTIAAMLVPQAMAYAELGGLPPSAGFRAALVALPIYVLLGTSRHLGIGPEPGTAILAAAAAVELSDGDPERYAALMATIAGLVGVMALVAGVLRFGFVADLLSRPVLVGYITGVGLTLLTSQLGAFTGAPIDAEHPFSRVVQFISRTGEIDGVTLVIGLSTLIVILGLRRWRPSWPGALIGLGATMLIASIVDLDIAVVGDIETAVSLPGLPDVSWADAASLFPAAAGVALIGYTDNILTARSISRPLGYEVDADRELVALGAVNLGGAVTGGFPMSSSASRSFVGVTIGSKSQLAGLVTFVVVLAFLIVGQPVLAAIPRPGLSAVIVAAAFAVIDIDGFRRIAALSRSEAALAAVTCLAVVGVDLLPGVVVAVGLSMLLTLGRVARPHDAVLGEGAGLDGWIDLDDRRARSTPGLLVYRFDGPLFFANGEYFRDRVLAAIDDNPGDETSVVLDMEGIGSIDSTAVEHLDDLIRELRANDIIVGVARANEKVIGLLQRAGTLDELGADRVFPTINAAVREHNDRNPD